MIRKRFAHFFLAMFFGIVTAGLALAPIRANTVKAAAETETSKPCHGLDVVFLVSYARSMGGLNDNIGLRKNALRTGIDIIGDNAIYLCPGYKHRISVVGFGDGEGGQDDVNEDTRTLVEPTLIEPELKTLSNWTTLKHEIFNQIPQNNYFIGNYSGYTNFQAGLERAADILAGWRTDMAGDITRRQALIIISDGAMCSERYGCDFDAAIRNMDALVDGDGKDLPRSVTIEHIGFYCSQQVCSGTPFFEINAIQSFWARVLRDHGSSEVRLLQHGTNDADRESANRDLDAKVAEILGELLGSDLGQAACNTEGTGLEPIWVEPYRNNFLILYVFRNLALEQFELKDVAVSFKVVNGQNTIAEIRNGQLVSGSIRYDYSSNGQAERYIFYLPPPGKYIIDVANADPCSGGVSVQSGMRGVLVEQLEPASGVQLKQVDKEPYFDVAAPQKFKFQVFQLSESGEKFPLERIEGYEPHLEVRLESQNDVLVKVNDVIDLTLVSEAEALWEANVPIDLRYAGHYQWDLVGITNNPRTSDPSNPISDPIQILSTQGNFEILPLVRGFDYAFSADMPDEIHLNDSTQGRPLVVSVRIMAEDGQAPLRSDSRIADLAAKPFRATLIWQNGTQATIQDTQPLTWQEGNIYTAQLGTGQYAIGCYEVMVELTSDYDSEYYIPAKTEPIIHKFCVKKTQFNYVLADATIPEDETLTDGTTGPINLAIQVTDTTGIALDGDLHLADSGIAPFIAQLIDQENTEIDSVAMQRQPNNTYTAILADATELRPTCYNLKIILSDAYRNEWYEPIGLGPLQQELCWIRWMVSHPTQNSLYPLHPFLSFSSSVAPMEFEMRFVGGLDDSEPRAVSASDVIRDDEQALFTGELMATGKSKRYPLQFMVDQATGTVKAQWPEEAGNAGDYRLHIEINSNNLLPQWILVKGPAALEVNFQRADTIFTNPWSGMAAVVLLLVLVILAVLLVLVNGPLALSVVNFETGSGRNVAPGQVKTSSALKTWNYTAEEKQCEREAPYEDLKSVNIRNGRLSTGDNGEKVWAADLKIIYKAGDDYDIEGLPLGEQVNTRSATLVSWAKAPRNFLSRSAWVVVLGSVLLAVYIGIFSYLFSIS